MPANSHRGALVGGCGRGEGSVRPVVTRGALVTR